MGPELHHAHDYLGREALEAAAAVQSSRAAPSVIRDLWRREHPGELHQMTPSVGQEATVGAYASQVRVPVRSVARDHGAGAVINKWSSRRQTMIFFNRLGERHVYRNASIELATKHLGVAIPCCAVNW